MQDLSQVHAFIPRQLKRRAFAEFAMQERSFSHWLREVLEQWVEERQGRCEGMDMAPRQEVACGAE